MCDILKMKSLVRTRPFNRDLARLPRDARADIVADLQAYAAGKTGYDVKRLRGVDEYRMKLLSYRVRFLEGAGPDHADERGAARWILRRCAGLKSTAPDFSRVIRGTKKTAFERGPE